MIYFARAGTDGLVKIGYTTNVEKRMSSLQCGCPVPLILLRSFEGDRADEYWLHLHFTAHRRAGEWFEFAEEMLTVIPTPIPPEPPEYLHARLPVIESFLTWSGISAKAFGVEVMRDPCLVYDLRKGRELRWRTEQRIVRYLLEKGFPLSAIQQSEAA